VLEPVGNGGPRRMAAAGWHMPPGTESGLQACSAALVYGSSPMACLASVLFTLRPLLIAVALLAGLVGCVTFVGCVTGLCQGEALQTAGDWVVFVAFPGTLLPLSAILVYLARWAGRTHCARQLAHEGAAVALELLCSQCQADTLVRGPQRSDWRFRMLFVARCLTCGVRYRVSGDTWQRLPWPQLGRPYETIDDKLDLMRHHPMTAGHAVCAAAGVVLGGAALACLVFVSWKVGWVVGGLAFMGPVAALWCLGYRLFPPPPKPGQRCVNCGYDLRACTEPRCPECGSPFDPDRVKIILPSPVGPDEPG